MGTRYPWHPIAEVSAPIRGIPACSGSGVSSVGYRVEI